MNGDISGVTADAYKMMIRLDFVSYVTAWILAIISRVNYKNTFSLVLLIIYSVLLVLTIIGIVVLFGIFMGL